jgi:hypothetical protein
LVEQSFNLERFGGAGVRILAEIVRGAECYRLTFSDLDEAVGIVEGLSDGLAIADQANAGLSVVVPSGSTR